MFKIAYNIHKIGTSPHIGVETPLLPATRGLDPNPCTLNF